MAFSGELLHFPDIKAQTVVFKGDLCHIFIPIIAQLLTLTVMILFEWGYKI